MGPFGGIGPTELIIVLVIALLILGPKKLPGLGKSIGSGLREFKESVSGSKGDSSDDHAEIPPSAVTPPPPSAPAEPQAAPVGGASDSPRGEAAARDTAS
jgi:sec-independent protein translocase protein TatA